MGWVQSQSFLPILIKTDMNKFHNTPNELVTDIEGNKYWISPSISVDAVLIVADRVLVIKRSAAMSNAGLWCLPCGFMDWNEIPLDACIRELYEETGVDVREAVIINADYQRPHSLNRTALQFRFVLQDKPEVNLDIEECIDYKWIAVDELHELNWAFGHDEVIRKLL